ncbi:10934_t:CDS:2 [Rhizophagus irregularis]|nr:10934_t:CDS:2 [Rhizophagus irregularis]
MKLDFIHYHENAVIPQNILVSLPLKLEADDLLAKPRRGKMPTRPPNNFLIFRTAYTRVLQSKGHWDLRMREVTSNAAAAWKNASKEVREECRKLALVAKKKHEEPSAHNTNINASFYFDDLISWQNIPYDMTFSPPESELGEPQPQFNSIYPPM